MPQKQTVLAEQKRYSEQCPFLQKYILICYFQTKNAVLNFTLPVALSKISFFHEEQNIPQCIVVRHSIRAAKILSVRMGLQRQRCQEEATLYRYVSCHQPGTQLERSFLLTANHSNLDFLTLSSYFWISPKPKSLGIIDTLHPFHPPSFGSSFLSNPLPSYHLQLRSPLLLPITTCLLKSIFSLSEPFCPSSRPTPWAPQLRIPTCTLVNTVLC